MRRNTLFYNIFKILRIQCNGYCLTSAQLNPRQNVPYIKDTNYILKIINNSNEMSLGKHVSGEYATELYNFRKTNGPYKSIADLSSVKDISDVVIKQLCESVLAEKRNTKIRKVRTQLLIPPLREEECKATNTLLGIHVGNNIVSWALMDKQYNILEWNYKSFLKLSQSADLFKISEFADNICWKLPKADLYITKENNISLNNKNRQYLNDVIQQQQLTAFIFAHLRKLHAGNSSPRLHIMRSAMLSYYYNLEVGHEVISTKNVIFKILNLDNTSPPDDHMPNLNLSKSMTEFYGQRSIMTKEQMNWALLMPATCLKLLVHSQRPINSKKGR